MIYMFIILLVLALEPIILQRRSWLWDECTPQYIVSTILLVVCSALVIVGFVTFIESVDEIAELEAFYTNTLSVYEYTIDKSERITIYAVKDAEKQMNVLFNAGNFAYFELAKSVNDNLKELREEIKCYNEGLFGYRKYNDFWFTDSFVMNVPEYLKPIKLK